jgi:hypothetical protein
MPENLTEKLQNLENLEFPKNLHGKIMQKLIFLKFRTPFLIVVSLLASNLFASGWYIWLNLKENASIETATILLEDTDLSASSFLNIFSTFKEIFPVSLMLGFLVNLCLVIYLWFVFYSFKKLPQKL